MRRGTEAPQAQVCSPNTLVFARGRGDLCDMSLRVGRCVIFIPSSDYKKGFRFSGGSTGEFLGNIVSFSVSFSYCFSFGTSSARAERRIKSRRFCYPVLIVPGAGDNISTPSFYFLKL